MIKALLLVPFLGRPTIPAVSFPQTSGAHVALSQLQSWDFQEAAIGSMPQGWTLDAPDGKGNCRFEIAEDPERPGRRCAVLLRKFPAGGEAPDVVLPLDGGALRGRRIRLRAELRVAVGQGLPKAKGRIWVTDKEGKAQVLDSMDDRPVISSRWMPNAWVVDVPENTQEIYLGLGLKDGTGKAWITSLVLEPLGATPPQAAEGARPLEDQGRVNLMAFAKAFGHLRYFHPSDEAAMANWNQLAIDGARRVEGALGAQDLGDRLQSLFRPVASDVRFVPSDRPGPEPVDSSAGAPLVRYVHRGFGEGLFPYFYASQREVIPPGPPARTGAPFPHTTQGVSLGGLVNLHDSLQGRTDPNGQALSAGDALPAPTGIECVSAEDRAVRLGDMIIAWNVLRHFYPYSDTVKIDWDGELAKALTAVASGGGSAAFLHALREMLAALKDGHAGAYGPTLGSRGFPDVRIAMVEGRPRVVACGDGIKDIPLGSEIVSVDGEPAAKRISYLATEISSPTQGWQNSVLAERLLEGAKTLPARIGFQPLTGPAGIAVLPRNGKPWVLPFPHSPTKIAEVKPGVWYVNADQVTDAEFESVLPKLQEAKSIIFDFRGYTSMFNHCLQYLATNELVTDRFEMPVITAPDGQGRTWETLGGKHPAWCFPKKPHLKGKAVFLAGGGSISAVETLLGMVVANRLGTIVGETTAGTNGNINRFWLPGRYQVSMTGVRVTKHNGTPHHGVGIVPDIPCRPTAQGLAEGRDEVLDKGIEIAEEN